MWRGGSGGMWWSARHWSCPTVSAGRDTGSRFKLDWVLLTWLTVGVKYLGKKEGATLRPSTWGNKSSILCTDIQYKIVLSLGWREAIVSERSHGSEQIAVNWEVFVEGGTVEDTKGVVQVSRETEVILDTLNGSYCCLASWLATWMNVCALECGHVPLLSLISAVNLLS